jgi:hypothetical protein
MLGQVETRTKELGRRVGARDIENALEDTVSIFEAVLKFIARRHLSDKGMPATEIEDTFRQPENSPAEKYGARWLKFTAPQPSFRRFSRALTTGRSRRSRSEQAKMIVRLSGVRRQRAAAARPGGGSVRRRGRSPWQLLLKVDVEVLW